MTRGSGHSSRFEAQVHKYPTTFGSSGAPTFRSGYRKALDGRDTGPGVQGRDHESPSRKRCRICQPDVCCPEVGRDVETSDQPEESEMALFCVDHGRAP